MDEPIFVSYARTDGEFALRLARDLRSANVDIWMDQLDIGAGDIWDRAVEDALQKCKGLLVILSPAAVASRSVMDEVSFAMEEGKKVIPVLYQTCEIPFRLRRVQRTDCASDYSVGLSKLIDALGGTPLSPVGRSGARDTASFATSSPRAAGFEDRVPRKPYWASYRPRLVTAVPVGMVGAVLAGAFLAYVYLHDQRVVLHAFSVWQPTVAGGLLAGALWAVAGAVAGRRRLPLLLALATSVVTVVAWRAFMGGYADVMATGVSVAWPVGGIIGATIGGRILRKRDGPQQSV